MLLDGKRVQVTVATFDRISIHPEKCGGQPCIRDRRVTVRRVLELLATYDTRAELLEEYPYLENEDLNQALLYAAAKFNREALDLDRVA